jgi:hypothetical protein
MFLISLIEILYIYYMFHIFETRLTINNPWEKFQLNYLNETVSERIYSFINHPTSDSSFPESKICVFGKKIIYLLLIYLLIRVFLPINFLKKLNPCVLLITFILSLANLNALIYLTPYFIIEIFLNN